MSEAEVLAKETEVVAATNGATIKNDAQQELTHNSPLKDHESVLKTSDDNAIDEGNPAVEVDQDGDSEAETLIESPEKRRSVVDALGLIPSTNGQNTLLSNLHDTTHIHSADGHSRKRKRITEEGDDQESSAHPSRRSSPLSSPAAFAASGDSDSDQRSRRRELKQEYMKSTRNGARDQSPNSESRSSPPTAQRRRPSDIIALKRDQHNNDSAERRETRSATYSRQTDDERSPSPQPIPRRDHRRGISTQLTGSELGMKKRGRPPLISTRRNRSAERAASVSSDDSNSPAPPRSAILKLVHDQDTMSPAKTGPRKWRDKNGRTFLARACNNNDLETAKARLAERPEDLNWADNAGNTPLQIAALEGFVDIVKFLLESNCDVDTRNIDRETPLIDAVENGHVEVVKLLLDYGANPRLGNAKGDEPYELVPQDDANYEEIRGLLAAAKDRESKKNKPNEQVETVARDGGSSRAASAASPRDSPPAGPRSPPTFASRRRTGRSESTRNDLLWQANTQENLTKLAGKGDVQGVASILNILQKAETESLIAAAKAGHEEVLQYLLGMGDPDPDPDPVRSLKPGYNTPILAAIGRGHADVVKLLVNQSGFNPTKKYKEKTYFELSRERKGQDWQQEHEILKAAYDTYSTSKGRKNVSPRKVRDLEKAKPKPLRRSSSPVSQKHMSSSPTMTHKSLPLTKSSESSPREKRKVSDLERRKILNNKIESVDNASAVASDLDQTVTFAKKGHRVRRSQSDLPPPQKLEPEITHRRRRLVTGKEHRRNKSAAPGSDSDHESREVIVVKQEEKPSTILKRARSKSSMSPELKVIDEHDKNRIASKKRRMVLESSPDETRDSLKSSHPVPETEQATRLEAVTPTIELPKPEEHGSPDVRMSDVEQVGVALVMEPNEEQHKTEITDSNNLQAMEDVDSGTLKLEPSSDQRPVAEKDVVQTSDEIVKEEAAEAAEAARLEAQKQAEAEAERLVKMEAERMAAAEAAAVVAAAKAEAEAEAEAEAKRIAEAEALATQRALDEERQRMEEQRMAEELELKRKAEEEAALLKQREEEHRREQMRREMEDRRRLQYLEAERIRREALPIVLNKSAAMIEEKDDTQYHPVWLNKFLPLFTVKTQQLEPGFSSSGADELWIANFQVAGLMAMKDLTLPTFDSSGKRKCTVHERQCLWRVARNMLSFEYEANAINTSVKQANQRENENKPKFLAMEELFWIKLSDFTERVSRHSHLQGLDIRTQPISLASYASSASPKENSPRLNGTHPAESRLMNGIHAHNAPMGLP